MIYEVESMTRLCERAEFKELEAQVTQVPTGQGILRLVLDAARHERETPAPLGAMDAKP